MKPAVVESLPVVVQCSGGRFRASDMTPVCVVGAGNLVTHASPHANVLLAGAYNVVLCGLALEALAPLVPFRTLVAQNRVVIVNSVDDAVRTMTGARDVLPLTPGTSPGRTEFPGPAEGNLVIRLVVDPRQYHKRRFGED